MALNVVKDWHESQMAQERARVMARIAYGTKASSPQIMAARRMNPLFYSNPLPDNSSGSKIRPFFASKDESGRASADQIVAMAQGKAHFGHDGMSDAVAMRGGVLRNYKYAKMILNRLGTDTENINLATQGIPPVSSGPGVTLDEEQSRNMELDALLQGIDEAVQMNTVSNLTIQDLKVVPRLLIYLAPTMDPSRVTQIIDFVDELLLEIRALNPGGESEQAKNLDRLTGFLQGVVRFLRDFVEYVGSDLSTRQAAAVALGRKVFKLKSATVKASNVAEHVRNMTDDEFYALQKDSKNPDLETLTSLARKLRAPQRGTLSELRRAVASAAGRNLVAPGREVQAVPQTREASAVGRPFATQEELEAPEEIETGTFAPPTIRTVTGDFSGQNPMLARRG